jgi:hypothetical protein
MWPQDAVPPVPHKGGRMTYVIRAETLPAVSVIITDHAVSLVTDYVVNYELPKTRVRILLVF